jgi:2-hydroxychromene-2-carboxylate isomerase
MPRLTFWYEFASPYSYLAAMRISDVADRAGVEVTWQPFLLGPIFKRQGWDTSPFNVYPAKGRYMIRDIERITTVRGQQFRMPAVFPANGLVAARMASLGMAPGWTEAFSRAVFEAEFGRGEDIADTAVLGRICAQLGQDFDGISKASNSESNKQKLRATTQAAVALGIFGAPTFATADGEIFWGDDRLEHAVRWALEL